MYCRPIAQAGPRPVPGALPLAGGWCWFDRVEVLERGRPPAFLSASELPAEVQARLCAPRAPVPGLGAGAPRLMGILNTTPDSFSDGGLFDAPERALAQARAMVAGGADILDIGGESTRPGAEEVPETDEIARTVPVIEAIRAEWTGAISIDTRKATVARAALAAGAGLVNDVSGFGHDPAMPGLVAESGAPVCLMHTPGPPETMQSLATYDDLLLDVYDWLAGRVAIAEAAGIPRDRILVDPGIGFGKTAEQNLTLLAGLSLFHGLGCQVLLGASRKRFIGTFGGAEAPRDRMPGSVAVALHGVAQGVQVLRVHDIGETRQALSLWMASVKGIPG
nr:dihydropteroate synthase [Kandeliimicrobium roseum]